MKNVLLLYKKSTYAHYFTDKRVKYSWISPRFDNMARFQRTHIQHYRTMTEIEQYLRVKKISYVAEMRGRMIDYSGFDFVLTVGGDGTFLEAAQQVTRQLILGINSDPVWSVGRFCAANSHTFRKVLDSILSGKFRTQILNRLKMKIRDTGATFNILNDVLVCHENPATMSRYILKIRGIGDEHRSSGIWISPAAGSTGAIRSAGGKILPLLSDWWQYMPRELYYKTGQTHKLRGGTLTAQDRLTLVSAMKDGVAYVDGSHLKHSLRLGDEVTIRKSSEPLKMVLA
ncbi:MAG: NAD(+)/NADH kinase [Candidatus Omnitrophota bacterium]|nr:NAD(+)/NADH kinase [Candidatus Omnitrophota bacterium]